MGVKIKLEKRTGVVFDQYGKPTNRFDKYLPGGDNMEKAGRVKTDEEIQGEDKTN